MSSLEIAALPIAEKLQLMELLWESLCRETSGSPNVPSWHGEVLAERIRRFDSGAGLSGGLSGTDHVSRRNGDCLPWSVPYCPFMREQNLRGYA